MMKVRLLRDARINHKAGDIVEVSPEQYAFLLSVNGAELVENAKAEPVAEMPEKPKRVTRKKV